MIRLEWVHAKAAAERWLEENHLLREELRRICVSFEAAQNRWALMAQIQDLDGARPVELGHRAFCQRQAYHYGRLLENATLNVESSVL